MEEVKESIKPVICILDTAPAGNVGSMRRYGDFLKETLDQSGFLRVKLVHLSLPVHVLKAFPLKIQTPLNRLWIIINAKIQCFILHNIDFFHVADGGHAYVALNIKNKPFIVTIHDIIPHLLARGLFPDQRKPGVFASYIIKQNKNAFHETLKFIAVSQNTSRDLSRYLDIKQDKIFVIYQPLSKVFLDVCNLGENPSWQERRDLNKPYILMVGTKNFYKNRRGTIKIFQQINKKVPIRMIIAGAPPEEGLLEYVKELGLKESIDFIVRPDDNRLVELYKNARLFIFPSLYEGFGLPPLEAMACGCPVISSDAASLPEVVGDAAMLRHPDDIDGFVDDAFKLLSGSSFAETMVVKGYENIKRFNIEKSTNDLLSFYKSITKELVSAGSFGRHLSLF
jgi:glycosyltransferase involved in cell wall biosynthesis